MNKAIDFIHLYPVAHLHDFHDLDMVRLQENSTIWKDLEGTGTPQNDTGFQRWEIGKDAQSIIMSLEGPC